MFSKKNKINNINIEIKQQNVTSKETTTEEIIKSRSSLVNIYSISQKYTKS